MNELTTFVNRLNRIGIKVKLAGNMPWIYLDSINGKRVSEKFLAEHGFTVMFYPIRKDQKPTFTDIPEIFRLIRKYATS